MVIELLAQVPRPLYRIFTDVQARNKPGTACVHKNVGTRQTQKVQLASSDHTL